MNSASPFTAKTMRVGVLALAGAATLSLAACSTSNKANPAQPPAPPSSPTSAVAAPTQAPTQAPPPAGGHQRVAGLIASVSGDTIQVTAQNGNSTVGFTPSTQVNEVSSASLPDVTPGSCVTLRPARGQNPQSGAFTVQMVRVSQAVGGNCPQPQAPPAGSTPPAPPPGGPSSPPRGNHPPILGTVASVAGDTITVNTSNPGGPQQATVTVTDRTRYTKEAASNTQAIAQGKCISAQGTDNGGTLQATTISLRPANNGECGEPGGGGPHRH
jgi:Domain of unknown function (DUF5666)